MWQSALKIAGLVALDLGLLAGLLMIPLGLPGLYVVAGLALAAAWLGNFAAIGWQALVVMAALVALAEILEALVGTAMTRRFGASWWGVLGAFLGGLAGAALGTAVFPLVGSVVGAFIGAAAGAAGLEAWHLRRLDAQAFRAGWGAFLGKLLASLLKVAIAAAMAIYVIIRTH